MSKPFKVYTLTYEVQIAVAKDTDTPLIFTLHEQLDQSIAHHNWLPGRSEVCLFEEKDL